MWEDENIFLGGYEDEETSWEGAQTKIQRWDGTNPIQGSADSWMSCSQRWV